MDLASKCRLAARGKPLPIEVIGLWRFDLGERCIDESTTPTHIASHSDGCARIPHRRRSAAVGGCAGGDCFLHERAVRDWNGHALAALGTRPTATVPGAGQPPPLAATHMAMVQIAGVRRGELDHGRVRVLYRRVAHGTFRASQDAAVATAAHDVLVGLGRDPVPALPDNVIDRLDTLYADFLATIPDGPAKEDGIAVGDAAAAAILAERDDDGRYVPFTFSEGTERWGVATHDERSDRPFAFMAFVRPFALESSSQFRTDGPKPLKSRAYAREYREVKRIGSTTSDRTPGQQALADFYTVSPVELFNRGFRGRQKSVVFPSPRKLGCSPC